LGTRKYGLNQQKLESRPYFNAGGSVGNKKIRPKSAKTRIQAVFERRRKGRKRKNTSKSTKTRIQAVFPLAQWACNPKYRRAESGSIRRFNNRIKIPFWGCLKMNRMFWMQQSVDPIQMTYEAPYTKNHMKRGRSSSDFSITFATASHENVN
jgi:hypothetical protein